MLEVIGNGFGKCALTQSWNQIRPMIMSWSDHLLINIVLVHALLAKHHFLLDKMQSHLYAFVLCQLRIKWAFHNVDPH